jgi:hypothetical protein
LARRWLALNREDREAQRVQAKPPHDSPERRQQLAESLEGNGDREAVNSRLLAHKHQGTPPTAAAAQKPSWVKTSKMAKPDSKGMTLERGGLECQSLLDRVVERSSYLLQPGGINGSLNFSKRQDT